jgi:tRNA(fMet)-specific endonuclease VapC
VAVFLAPFELLPFDDDDARAAGAIRAELERAGTPIGAYDTLLAGQAIRRGLVLVTANVAEFERVTALQWTNWAI